MEAFFNERIEGPLSKSFMGRNQFVYTGNIDDLFLINHNSGVGNVVKLCGIEDVFREYGNNQKYDVVVVIKEDLSLEFANPQQQNLFVQLTVGDSTNMVPEQQKRGAQTFVPGQRSRDGHQNANNARTVANAMSDISSQKNGSESVHSLEKITRLLRNPGIRSLVIFPYPEKLISGGKVTGTSQQVLEVVVKNWRNLGPDAHRDSRTILIVNPHRLEEFHNVEHYLSCFDHNCCEISISQPPVKEMLEWVKEFKTDNGILGKPFEEERIALIGKANGCETLQNFVSWVKKFYDRGGADLRLRALIDAENQEAVASKDELLAQLDQMIGLNEVKEKIRSIVSVAESNIVLAADSMYHMFFLGNPGTGKTEVANLVAKLFWAIELRTSNKVVSVAIHDIISQYNEGDTLQRMKEKIQEAMGGVLFIDEAYLFTESEWGRKAFQVLLTEMENNRKNLTVILAGYEDRLQGLKDINPGIESRIPWELRFGDYTAEEKLEIFKLHLARRNKKNGTGYRLTDEAESKLKYVLEECDGNGRGVRNVLDKTLTKVAAVKKSVKEIDASYIIDPHAVDENIAKEVFSEIDEQFTGMEGLKGRLRAYLNKVRWDVERRKRLKLKKQTSHGYRIRFTGPPGTGKTSIARYMGKFFHALGVCEVDGIVECGATTLKGAYIGHAQKAVNDLFHSNKGKVIFIDEIYSLYNPEAHQDDSFSREVIDTLVRCLTAREYQNTVVIVAGYKDRVDRFMEANPGLASRIPDEIEFEDYSARDCVRIFDVVATKSGYLNPNAGEEGQDYQAIEKEVARKLETYFDYLRAQPNFGNARDVNGVFSLVESRIINRVLDSDTSVGGDVKDVGTLRESDFRTIAIEDVPEPPKSM